MAYTSPFFLALTLLLVTACSDPSPTTAPEDDVVATPADTAMPEELGETDAPDDAGEAAPEPDVVVRPRPVEYAAGYMTWSFDAPSGNEVDVAIWYPAVPEDFEPAPYYGILQSSAFLEAEIVDGTFPLIVFSHGNQGIREQSVFLTEDLARRGYVVVAANHEHNTFLDYDGDLLAQVAQDRPRLLTTLLNRIEAPADEDPPFFATHLDLTRIGAAGHSFGAYTMLAIGGAPPQAGAALIEFCSTHPNDFLCKLADLDAEAPEPAGDDRIKAIVPISPAGHLIFGVDGLAQIDVPVLIVTGKADQLTTFANEAKPVFDALGPPKYLWSLEDGAHFTFTNICEIAALLPDDLKSRFGVACLSDAPLAIETAHQLTQHIVARFFDRYLRDDATADDDLRQTSAEAVDPQIRMISVP